MKKKEKKEKKLNLDKTKEDAQITFLIARYKDIANRWNQIASFLAKKSEISKEITPEQHAQWLAMTYYQDVLFLLNQLGVVNVSLKTDNKSEEETKKEEGEKKNESGV